MSQITTYPQDRTGPDEPRISVADVAVNSILTHLTNGSGAPQPPQAAPIERPIISVIAKNTEISEGESWLSLTLLLTAL